MILVANRPSCTVHSDSNSKVTAQAKTVLYFAFKTCKRTNICEHALRNADCCRTLVHSENFFLLPRHLLLLLALHN
jgi:hypothetical protein